MHEHACENIISPFKILLAENCSHTVGAQHKRDLSIRVMICPQHRILRDFMNSRQTCQRCDITIATTILFIANSSRGCIHILCLNWKGIDPFGLLEFFVSN